MTAYSGYFSLPFIQFIPVIAWEIFRDFSDTADIGAVRNSTLIAFIWVGALLTGSFLSISRSIN